MLRGLYAITDPVLTPPPTLLHQVQAALRGGARVIQYRDKTSPAPLRQQLAQQLRELTRNLGALLIINDDVNLCLECEADGVHLGQEDTPVREARQRLGRTRIIGATCHGSRELAESAMDQGANYLAFGRFFPSRTKPDAQHADLESLRDFIQACPLPTVAIGGITLNNAGQLIEAGFSMVAAVNDVFDRDDIEQHCQQYSNLFR
ncbi:thiamine phosphate synthase [Ketobacter sp.]|uniref:thiamine phosphate synthase n=1 Tax=Ketobacter sp. TaxID=2083498 RepID=UPI000F174151|nr:thiamine phosphate synthase [Ketobacter sp.]RLU01081.1 MAG: thiamine phosphate synthase [Ketobacter sp.]